MYEIDIRFSDTDIQLKDKIQLFAQIHNIPTSKVWSEYDKLSDYQLSELRKWQYLNSLYYKSKGVV